MQKRSPVGAGPSGNTCPEMGVAGGAQDFYAAHEQGVVLARGYRVGRDGLVEARGQPHPESYLVRESNSGASQHLQL